MSGLLTDLQRKDFRREPPFCTGVQHDREKSVREQTERRFYTHRSRKRTRMQCSYKTGCGLTKAGLALFFLNWEISELRLLFSPAARKTRAKREHVRTPALGATERLSGKCRKVKSI